MFRLGSGLIEQIQSLKTEEDPLVAGHVTEESGGQPLVSELTPANHNGRVVSIGVYLPRNAEASFVRDVGQLTRIDSSACSRIPHNVFLCGAKQWLDESGSEEAQAYRNAVKVGESLAALAYHKEECAGCTTLFFEGPRFVRLPIRFADPPALCGEDVAVVDEYARGQDHQLERRQLLGSVLCRQLQAVDDLAKYQGLLTSLHEFASRLTTEYTAFVKEFSLDAITDELAARKSEYINRANGAVAAIQNELLAIPVSTIVVGTQITRGEGWDLSNLVIFVSFLTFFVFLMILVHNQWLSLDAIADEVEHHSGQLRAKYASLGQTIAKGFDTVQKRISHQRRVLRTVVAIATAALAFSAGRYAYSFRYVRHSTVRAWDALTHRADGGYPLPMFDTQTPAVGMKVSAPTNATVATAADDPASPP